MGRYDMSSFLDACGATDPLRLAVTPAQSATTTLHVLHQPFAVFGRAGNAEVRLEGARISRRHAYLQTLEGRVCCVDLGSRGGVDWPGASLRGGWLPADRTFRLASFHVRVDSGFQDGLAELTHDDPLSSLSQGPPGLPSVVLEFEGASNRIRKLLRSRVALIGRAPWCKLRLQCPSVSRFHCSLVRTAEGLWVVDLLGRGGIRVNGQRLRFARLDEGDRLQVGRFRIRLCSGPAGAAPALREPQTIVHAPHFFPAGPVSAERALALLTSDPNFPLAAPDLAPLVPFWNQLVEMQRQLADQLRMAMTNMVQTYGRLHRDQVRAIRKELEQLRNLKQEMQALQKELRRTHPSDALTGDPAPEDTLDALLTAQLGEPVRPAETSSPNAAEIQRSVAPLPNVPASPSDTALHARFSQRIYELQKERQTRWGRILALLTGK
jgi:pSer/pThr/pTyr-binding forkhead associated (FHA) protein